MNITKKQILSFLVLALSIFNSFCNFNYYLIIFLILLFIVNNAYALILYNRKTVVNAELGWYVLTKENMMLIIGIVLTGLNIYNILNIKYLWLVLNIIILIVSLIKQRNIKDRIY